MGQLTKSWKILPQLHNIWRYSPMYADAISQPLTLDEGHTPLQTLHLPEFPCTSIYLKREDLNPNGSHKDRSAAYQISYHQQQGIACGVVSSSGNAAASLAAYARKANIRLFAFLKPDTHPSKLRRIQQHRATVLLSTKPINFSNYTHRRYGLAQLRPSLDPKSQEGYQSIAWEIYESFQDQQTLPDAIFLFTTSGSTLLGIYKGFQLLQQLGKIPASPSLHPVQAGPIHSLTTARFNTQSAYTTHTAGKGGAPHTPLKQRILQAVSRTRGRVWWISNGQIEEADQLLQQANIHTSWEGVAAFAAAIQALRQHLVLAPVILFTGHQEQKIPSSSPATSGLPFVQNYQELRTLLEKRYNLRPIQKHSA